MVLGSGLLISKINSLLCDLCQILSVNCTLYILDIFGVRSQKIKFVLERALSLMEYYRPC